jgi:hypothetical protein
MSGPLVLAVLVLVATLVGLVALVVRLARRPALDPLAATPATRPLSPPQALLVEPVVRALRQARTRALVGVGVATLALVAGLAVDATRPELVGLPIALTPGLAAVVGLLVATWLPSRPAAVPGAGAVPGASVVSAPLTPRTATSFGTRTAFAVPAGVAVVYLGFLAWAAAVAAPDEAGRLREFTVVGPGWSSSAGPFPGSYYGLPLAVVTVLLAATTLLALRRVALTPVLPVPGLDGVDRHWRVVSTRIIVRISTAALLGYVGGSLFFAGHAIRSAAGSVVAGDPGRPGTAVAGAVLLGCGVMALVAGVAVALLAVLAAVTLRSVRPATSPAAVPSVPVSPTRG